jgi:diguanylate cyclase (GGDEF)-like protein
MHSSSRSAPPEFPAKVAGAGRGNIVESPAEYTARLRELQRREWWSWGYSLVVMLLLTGAIASLAFPAILQDKTSSMFAGVPQALAGLTIMILLFGAYLTYEKFLINRLRLELAEKQVHSTLWRNLALIDPLTGLFNRRYAERQLRAEVARSQRKGYALTLVLFDLNRFKQINDRFGHPVGDLVLKEFGGRLNKAVREGDLAARLGGDEFLWLLTECTSTQLPALLRRLESIEVRHAGQAIPVNFACGWAEYQQGKSPQDLLNDADKALYLNKQAPQELAPVPA